MHFQTSYLHLKKADCKVNSGSMADSPIPLPPCQNPVDRKSQAGAKPRKKTFLLTCPFVVVNGYGFGISHRFSFLTHHSELSAAVRAPMVFDGHDDQKVFCVPVQWGPFGLRVEHRRQLPRPVRLWVPGRFDVPQEDSMAGGGRGPGSQLRKTNRPRHAIFLSVAATAAAAAAGVGAGVGEEREAPFFSKTRL